MATIASLDIALGIDTRSVERQLGTVQKQFAGIDKQLAALGKGTTARVGADTTGASRAFAKTDASLERISHGATANVDADASGASKVFGKVSSFLDRVTHGATAPVAADASLAQRTFGLVESKLQSLAHGVTVPIRAEQQGSTSLANPTAIKKQGASGGDAFAGGLVGSLAKKAPLIASALLVGGVITSGLKRLTTIQDASVALKNLLGSQAAAAAFTAQIVKTVTGTPFNLDAFLTAGKNLVAFNVPAQKVPGILTAVGNAAASTGKGQEAVDQLTTTFGKMAAQGTVQLDDVWSVAGAGVPALQILANGFHTTTGEIQKMISKGAVPAGKAIDVLSAGIMKGSDGMAGHTNGLGGSMEALRKTFNGSFGGMKAAAARLGATLLAPLIGPATKGMTALATGMNKVGGVFKNLGPKLKPAGDALKLFFGVVTDNQANVNYSKLGGWATPIIQAGEKVRGFVDWFKVTWSKLFGGDGGSKGADRASKAMKILGEMMDSIKPTLASLGKVFGSALGAIGAIVSVAVSFVMGIWDRFGGQLLDHLLTAWHAIQQVLRGVFQILGGLFDFIRDLLTGKWGKLWNDILKILAGVWNLIVGTLKQALNVVSLLIGLAMAVVSSLWFRAWDGIHRAFVALWGLIERAVMTALLALGAAIGGALAWIAGVWRWVWSGISSFASGIWDGIKKVVGGAVDWVGSRISSAWGGLASLVAGIWSGVQSAIEGPINAIRHVISGFLDAAADVAGALHLPIAGALKGAANSVNPSKANAGFMGPHLATGGLITSGPQVLVGEGNPAYPEFVVPTDPKHRGNALKLTSQLTRQIGLPGMASGGIFGDIGKALGGAFDWGKSILAKGAQWAVEHAWPSLPLTGTMGDLLAGGANAIRQGVIDFIGGSGGSDGGGGGGGPATGPLAKVMAAVRAHESGGNYHAQNRFSTASGAYQVLDSTWHGYGGFARATLAPNNVQDSYAAGVMGPVLAKYGIPGVAGLWYVGNPARGLDPSPVGGAGNAGSVLDYTHWLEKYVAHMAAGGIVKSKLGGTLALLGEGGHDEAVVPLPSGLAHAGVTVNLTINGNVSSDIDMTAHMERFGRDLSRKLAKL